MSHKRKYIEAYSKLIYNVMLIIETCYVYTILLIVLN
jgi:hypothetical protein